MKRIFCLLLCLLMMTGMACAEPAASETTVTEIAVTEVAVTETAVTEANVAEADVAEADVTETAAAEEAAAEEAVAEVAEATDAAPASTPVPAESVILNFEDGFSLKLPAGWMYYTITEEMAAQGVLYCLSDESARRWLYIQSWDTDCTDIDSLQDLIDRTAMPQTSGIYTFNGTDFVIYDLVEGDVSCCAALVDGRVLNFVFTPQSDAAFMATATQIIGSFGVLAK